MQTMTWMMMMMMMMTAKPLGPREVSEAFVFPRLCAMAHAGIVKRPRGTSSVMVRLITLVSVFLGGAVLYANVVRAHTAPRYQGQCMLQQAVPTTRREVMQMTTTQPAVMMTSAPAPSLQAARMGSVKALTSVSSCMGRIWMEQRLSSAACTGPKWRHCFHMQADAHILEKMSWMQRDIANSDWQRLREQAERYLSNERLANWGNWVTANAQGHRSAGQRRE